MGNVEGKGIVEEFTQLIFTEVAQQVFTIHHKFWDQGIDGKLITKVLSEFKPKIYSTVRTENIGMNKIMNSLGFKKVGNEYKAERGDYYNFLYLKTK